MTHPTGVKGMSAALESDSEFLDCLAKRPEQDRGESLNCYDMGLTIDEWDRLLTLARRGAETKWRPIERLRELSDKELFVGGSHTGNNSIKSGDMYIKYSHRKAPEGVTSFIPLTSLGDPAEGRRQIQHRSTHPSIGGRQMSEAPHVQAAFINAIRDEGTKAEACDYLQKQWNETCALRTKLAKAVEALRPFSGESDTWDDGLPDNTEMTIGLVRFSPTKTDWTLGDLRRAATIIKEIEHDD